MKTNGLPDINNLKESDIEGIWRVMSVSYTDSGDIFHSNIDREFHFLKDQKFIYKSERIKDDGTWELIHSSDSKPIVVIDRVSRYQVTEIKKNEMKLVKGLLEHLLNRVA